MRIVAGGFDGDRIEKEINARGGELISKQWSPFGKGWFGENSDRIYKVSYFDKDRNEHEAYVKTSMFSGVYFTEDKVVRYADGHKEEPETGEDALVLENERLKAELKKLKNQ